VITLPRPLRTGSALGRQASASSPTLVHAYPAPLRVGEENRVEHPLDAMSRNCEQPIME
jgi:hypothetical protein